MHSPIQLRAAAKACLLLPAGCCSNRCCCGCGCSWYGGRPGLGHEGGGVGSGCAMCGCCLGRCWSWLRGFLLLLSPYVPANRCNSMNVIQDTSERLFVFFAACTYALRCCARGLHSDCCCPHLAPPCASVILPTWLRQGCRATAVQHTATP
jgi:hypothetical protein